MPEFKSQYCQKKKPKRSKKKKKKKEKEHRIGGSARKHVER
jgi:hypothetical protein